MARLPGVTCAQCNSENPPGARFCCQCGTPLRLVCATCGTEALPGARFCHNCGTPQPGTKPVAGANGPPPTASAPADVAARPPNAPPASERRHLTVMFCDVVGSTAISRELDPEDLQLVLREYQAVCEAMIRRFDGHVAQFLGDGILVYFGYPQAHEDDPHRAVRAALAIVEALSGLNERIQTGRIPRIQVRIGIHTGIVVIGEMGGAHRRAEQLALGETPNLAARIQGLAEPNTVLISEATHRLVAGYFECRTREAQSVKGFAQPVAVLQVLHETTARSRLEVVGKSSWTPLVGREQEMSFVLARWERAKEGFGEVVVVSGEGGIGKSRLVQAIVQRAADEGQAWLTPLQCSPYHRGTALYPMIDFLNRVVLQFEKNDSVLTKWSRLEGLALQYGLPPAETAALFASLLAIPIPDEQPALNLTPERQKQKILQLLETILIERSSRQPLLFLVEDLQWVDPTTLELLTHLLDQVPTRRILALYTCRPDFDVPWQGRTHVTQLNLSRLSRREIADMVPRLTHGKTLPPEVLEHILTKTDGVPLFVEELTKMILESQFLAEEAGHYRLDGPLPSLAIPATLQDSLMARLDRLSSVKEVAQLAAVLGREFTYELLLAVAELDPAVLRREIEQLVEAELLYLRGTPPSSTYIFKHALIQEAAYQSLLKSKRQQYHLRVAEVLRQRFQEIAATQPEVLAHHCTEAGMWTEAIVQWQRAGEQAIQRSAHLEAIAHHSRGLELLAGLPDNPERQKLEIALHIGLGPSLTAIKGYGSEQVERTYARARQLADRLGESSQLFRALYGLWRLNMLRAQHEAARAQGRQLLELARGEQSVSFPVAAHRALGSTLFYLGDLAGSCEHIRWVLAATSAPSAGSNALIQDVYDVVDPRVTCRCYHAWNLWLLGQTAAARLEFDTALALARELKHPFSLALALSFGSWLYQFFGNVARTHELSDAALRLAGEQGFLFWIGWGRVLRGWAASHDGDGAAALAEMRQGLAEWRAQGSELGCTYFLTLLAGALARHGHTREALAALADAETCAHKTAEHYWLAERHRITGEVLLAAASPPETAAEALFEKARLLARAQQARSLELRAALSLARLRHRQKRSHEIAGPLEPILAHFAEDPGNSDVLAARALLP